MQEFDPSKFEAWKGLPADTRNRLLAELKTLAREVKPQPSELLTEAGRIGYAEAHAKCALVRLLEVKINGNDNR